MKIIKNPDEKIRTKLEEALKAKDGYCPCRLERTPENKCMCKEFREMASGTCHCGARSSETR